MPAEVVAEIAPLLDVLTIGIGAGPATDGQVLVFNDLTGIYDGPVGRFVKRYANARDAMLTGVRTFADEVRTGRYPAAEHCYSAAEEEVARFRELLAGL